MTDDLITFIRAQLDERERAIRDAVDWGERSPVPPDELLAEVDAKRRILDLHEGDHECSTIHRGVDYDGKPYEEIDNCTWVVGGDCSTVRLLALPHAGRDGYREDWRP